MKKILSIITVLILMGTGLYIVQSSNTQRHEIIIGVALPLSGDGAVLGEKAQRGITLALEEMPEMNIIYEDTTDFTAKGALSAATKLLSIDSVDVLFGPLGPEASLAVAPRTEERGILHFAYSLCSPSFKDYEQLFCIYPSVKEQLSQTPEFLESQGIETIVLITEQSEYGNEAASAIKNGAEKQNYNVTLEEKFTPEQTDMRTIATKIITQDPDAIFVASQDVIQNFLLLKQLHELGYNGIRIAYTDIDPSYLEDFSESVEGIYVPGVIGNNFSAEYMSAYQEKYEEEPDLYSAIAYDVFRYLYGAWKDNDKNLQGIERVLVEYSYKNSAISGYNFSSERRVLFPTQIWKVEGGEFKPIQVKSH